MTLDRRRFLQLGALGVVATFTDYGCAVSNDRAGAAIDRPQLLDVLGPDRVRQLGAHYRAATPKENTADALRAAISSGHSARIPFVNASLDNQVRDDFANGRTVMIDGWVLSVTEARQAALFSLTPA